MHCAGLLELTVICIECVFWVSVGLVHKDKSFLMAVKTVASLSDPVKPGHHSVLFDVLADPTEGVALRLVSLIGG